ncbi:hypothetical protein [Siccirubricoccus sp. G192]|uniref:hypothetical protein n=1 Tax=Siccirubricoccus sp. G192 TaxID=2849651 RepID=UPI002810D14F|nr:hypothetical protein [Siccirubricoccus sp. G192]
MLASLQEQARLAERMNGLVHATVSESHGILVPAGDPAAAELSRAIADFLRFRAELARAGVEQGAAAADAMGNNEASRAKRQAALNQALLAVSAASMVAADSGAAAVRERGAVLATTLPAANGGGAALVLLGALWLIRSRIARPLSQPTVVMTRLAGRRDLHAAGDAWQPALRKQHGSYVGWHGWSWPAMSRGVTQRQPAWPAAAIAASPTRLPAGHLPGPRRHEPAGPRSARSGRGNSPPTAAGSVRWTASPSRWRPGAPWRSWARAAAASPSRLWR